MSDAIKDIDDVDDELFISRKPQNYIFADKKAQDINERTTRSLTNSKRVVEETKKIGESTLESLSSQRETLDKVENDLDNMNTIARATQKNLNNMRSFYGFVKSLFSNSSNSTPPAPTVNRVGLPRSNTLASVPSNIPANSTNPSSTSNNRTSSNNQEVSSSASPIAGPSIGNQPQDQDGFEAHLSELGFGLGVLKQMAVKIGDEIVDGIETLDRITDKSERAADSIKHQNRQIQQLLKKG